MKKLRLIGVIILAFFAFNVQGQINAGLTVGPQMPMGDFGDAYGMGFGAIASGKYMLNDYMAVGLNIGYVSLGEEIEGFKSSMMPITGLFEYRFGDEGFIPYAGLDLGMYNFSWKAEFTFMGATTEISDSKMYFGFAPTVGGYYMINDGLMLNGNLKYNSVSTEGSSSTFLGVNVGAVIVL